MTFFRKGELICLISKNEEETFENFLERGNFIVNQYPKDIKEYNKSILYSFIYINVKYLHCKYDEKILDELNKMIKNCVKINI